MTILQTLGCILILIAAIIFGYEMWKDEHTRNKNHLWLALLLAFIGLGLSTQ